MILLISIPVALLMIYALAHVYAAAMAVPLQILLMWLADRWGIRWDRYEVTDGAEIRRVINRRKRSASEKEVRQ